MNRLCERPGCSAPAEVAYGFDADLLIVWLDALVEVQGIRFGVLCRRHADAMIVPLGWMLDDHREPTLRLFKSPATDVPLPRPKRERWPRDETGEQLRLDPALLGALPTEADVPHDLAPPYADDEDVPTRVVTGHPAPVGPQVDEQPSDPPQPESDADPAWMPVFDPADDLHGLLNARGRLLSRAFNGAPTDS